MKLLVVEDEAALAASLRRGLQAAGFAVDSARDGIEALWMATETSYDTILLDVLLPGLDGFSVCRTLRERQVWTPVLVLTALDEALDEAEALDSGADDFLRKPFAHVVLLARVRALLRRGGGERPAILEAGDLVLDPASRRSWRGTSLLELTPRETSVLEYLMRHAGRAVSKPELLEHVWDESRAGDGNLVEVYVSYLRRKVDAPFGRTTIQTVRGTGYRLDPRGR